jgi:hypothetical protein
MDDYPPEQPDELSIEDGAILDNEPQSPLDVDSSETARRVLNRIRQRRSRINFSKWNAFLVLLIGIGLLVSIEEDALWLTVLLVPLGLICLLTTWGVENLRQRMIRTAIGVWAALVFRVSLFPPQISKSGRSPDRIRNAFENIDVDVPRLLSCWGLATVGLVLILCFVVRTGATDE